MKKSTKPIIFANGCFDILHPGHYHFLQSCINLAKDKDANFMLAIDSDKKIKQDKGQDRPIFNLKERQHHILMVFPQITSIFSFNTNEELKELIKSLKPIILVKGKRWKGNVVGKEHAQEIFYVSDINAPSTTDIINRIKNIPQIDNAS